MMSRDIVVSGETSPPKTNDSNLTVPSENRDVRIVDEGSQKPRRFKRKSFQFQVNMAKGSKEQKSRPVRKIKLNRSIFNAGFQGKPAFHVKTLEEIKSEKQKLKATTAVESQSNVNIVETAAQSPEGKNITTDTRRVLKTGDVKKLMMPAIQLTRISSGEYSRSFKKGIQPENIPKIAVTVSETSLRRLKTIVTNNVSNPLHGTAQQSPVKKRKISPVRSPDSEPRLKGESFLNSWSPSKADPLTQSDEKPPSPPMPPASPPLSLGAASDQELDDQTETTGDARVVINAGDKSKENFIPLNRQKVDQTVFNSSPATVERSWAKLLARVGTNTCEDDRLDVMSIMADDDELFQDEKPRPALKRSLSQDSVFGMTEDQNNRGDLRRLLKKPKDKGSAVKHPVGDLISSRPIPSSYKIPNVNKRCGKVHVNDFVGVQRGPKFPCENTRNNRPARLFDGPRKHMTGNFVSSVARRQNIQDKDPRVCVSSQTQHKMHGGERKEGQSSKGLSPQGQAGLLRGIAENLKNGNVGEAWLWIKKLDQMKYGIDVPLLEEALMRCERVSASTPSPVLGDAALGVFDIIKRRRAVKSTDLVMLTLTLGHCQRIQEAFDHYASMKAQRLLPHGVFLERFVNDLCKCLLSAPGMIIEVIHDARMFPIMPKKKDNIINSCISFLIGCQPDKLKIINAETWNSLLRMLSSVPVSNIQCASQVHNLMKQNEVPLDSAALLQFFKLCQDSKSLKLLLTLLCSKATRDILVAQNPPVDVDCILSNTGASVEQFESCYAALIQEGTMPSQELLHHFIGKASLLKEYRVIYQFFLKCERSCLLLPLSALKEMVEVLENWDENADASVQVYAALRQAKKAVKVSDVAVQVIKKEGQIKHSDRFNGSFKPRICYSFESSGHCFKGDHCRFSHVTDLHHPFSSRNSLHAEQESIGECQSSEESVKSGGKSEQLNCNTTSPFEKSGLGVGMPDAGVIVKEKPPRTSKRFNGSFKTGVCFAFQRSGHCHRGDRCKFSHIRGDCHPFSSRDLECSEKESVGECQSPANHGNSGAKSLHFNPSSPIETSAASVAKPLVNSTDLQNTLKNGLPFPSFQVFPPGSGPHLFNSPLFNRKPDDRPLCKPKFQRSVSNQMPRFSMSSKKTPCGPSVPAQAPPPLNVPQVNVVYPNSSKDISNKKKIGRSFSWEPKQNYQKSPEEEVLSIIHHPYSNNNDKEIQQLTSRLQMAIKAKGWQEVYTCYVDSKVSSGQKVKDQYLKAFRNSFVRDNSGGLGQNFSNFVDFMSKESNSGKSCHSNESGYQVFDPYDVEFIGAVGVSVMERCLVTKQFDEGYEVLLSLHSHNVSYFQSGRNFGAYTKDIPPECVALIAVKLCLGIPQHGLLGAMVVLRACNYALGEEGEVRLAQDEEYRVKVLHQLFLRLFENGHIAEAHELVQNLHAAPNVLGPMYLRVLNSFIAQDDFNQAFVVLDEMQEKGLNLNIPPSQHLYNKVLLQCAAKHDYDQMEAVLKQTELKQISVDGQVLREILNGLLAAEQSNMVKLLFQKCSDLEVYPATFCKDTPWLCELGSGYSQLELRLLIQKHLEELQNHLLCTKPGNELINVVKNFQIVLFPRLSGVNSELKFSEGFQSSLVKSGAIVESIMQQEFNPPLAVLNQSGEQFHRKIIVEKMSVYRWFNANACGSPALTDLNQEECEISSQRSIDSDVSGLSDSD